MPNTACHTNINAVFFSFKWWEWSWSPLLLLLLQHLFVLVTETWLRSSSILWSLSVICTAHTLSSTLKVLHSVWKLDSIYDFKIFSGIHHHCPSKSLYVSICCFRKKTWTFLHIVLSKLMSDFFLNTLWRYPVLVGQQQYATQSSIFSHTGVLPPRPPPPSTNGTLQMQDRIVVCQTGQPARRPCLSRLNEMCTFTRWRYFLACAAIIVFFLILILIFAFLGKICICFYSFL